jgi:Domain of unknown function (DUF4783)
VIFGLVFAVSLLLPKEMYIIEMNHTFKKLLFLTYCVLMFGAVHAQNITSSSTPLEDIVNAIKNDRAADLNKYLDNFVPLTINNAQTIYSRNQAEVVLKDFFDKNIPKDFDIINNGSPDNSSKFIIGNMDATNGIRYNVYILIKLKDGNYLLQDFRLNKE